MRKILILSLALFMTGCSTSELLKSSEPQQTIYALRTGSAKPVTETGPARIVEITKPSVPPGFDTDRIALYTEQGHKLDYFSAAKWPDILDNVMQDFTRRAITETLPYVVAITSSQALDADFRLQTKVNEFQPVYNSDSTVAPTLLVSIEFTLVSLPEEHIVKSFSLVKREEAASNRLDVIAAGLEAMLREVERDAFARLDPVMKRPDPLAE